MFDEAGSNLPCEPKHPLLVNTDKQCVHTVGPRPVSADNELLLLIEFELHPSFGTIPSFVLRVPTLRDDALQAKASNCGNDLRNSARQLRGEQNPGIAEGRLQHLP